MRFRGVFFSLFVFLLLVPHALFGQSNTARIVGTVTDLTGGVIPGASVEATNLETNLTRIAISNDVGNYTVANLPVGRYELSAEMPGFKTFRQGPIELQVGQTARISIVLTIGEMSDEVRVEAGAPLINTEDPTIGEVIGEHHLQEIPLSGRNFIQLAHLVPGTTTGPPNATTVRSRQGGVSLTANGQRQDQNNWLLDGIDNNAQFFGMVVIIPSLDAIREFQVQTSNYSAEFGRSAGAVVNLETKGGGNQFHGALYHFHRNDNFDAAEFFASIDENGNKIKAPLVFNQFGGSIGGPVLKDRTFFFFNYEGKRVRRGLTLGTRVPTLANRSGDFSGGPTVFDPFAIDSETGQRLPFAGNVIPSERIHPASSAMLEFIPLPNNDDPARNFVRVVSRTDDFDQYHVRIDQQLSDKQWLMGRFSDYRTENFNANTLPLDADILTNDHWSLALQHTYTLSPNLISEFRVGGNHYNFAFEHETAGQDFTSQFGLPSAAPGSRLDGFPDTQISGMARFGGNAAVPLDRIENSINLVENLSWIRGNHNLKLGGSIRRYTSKNFQPLWARGRYTFTGVFTGTPGNGFADFLLGIPAQQRLLFIDPDLGLDPQRPENWWYSLYVQDDWKARPNLTLNLGLRYERDGNWTTANNQTAVFDPVAGEVVYARDYNINFFIPFPHRFKEDNILAKATNSLGPRLGFAWRPRGDTTLVVRGGYGIFWSPNTGQSMINTSFVPPALIQDIQISSSTFPEISFGESGFGDDPDSLLPTTPGFTVNPLGGRKNPYTQQWNLTLEKALLKDVSLSVAYVGNNTVNLEGSYAGNPALPPAPGAIQPRRRYPEFSSISFQDSFAHSNYNALQVKAQKRFSEGFSFLSGYTWSKSLDNHGGEAESSGAGIQNPDDRAAAKGLSGFDLRHRFTFSGIYYLPFGRGMAYGSDLHPAVNAILGGWQVTGILTLQSGFPFTPTVSGDIANAAAGTMHPNLMGDNHGRLGSERTIDRWFDTGAFSVPSPNTFGNAGRNILIAPGKQVLDLGIFKNFNLYEDHQLEFRLELFNALNHTNFGFPGASVGAANFGVIRSADSPREIQVALKYTF